MNERQLQNALGILLQGHHNLKARVCRMEALEKLRMAGREPTLPIEFRSQFGEDAMLWDLFSDQLDGFFIEVGAHDGLTFSVSYAFESIGWRGLLVEPLPDAASACARNRPNSRVVHAALSKRGSGGTTAFNVVQGAGGEQYSYLHHSDEHARRIAAEGGTSVEIQVPLTTMDALLADHRGTIDFASIDVEGGELALLDGFDLDRFRPRALLVEENVPSALSPLTAHLARFGYVQAARQAVNNLYVRRDDAEMQRRAKQISP